MGQFNPLGFLRDLLPGLGNQQQVGGPTGAGTPGTFPTSPSPTQPGGSPPSGPQPRLPQGPGGLDIGQLLQTIALLGLSRGNPIAGGQAVRTIQQRQQEETEAQEREQRRQQEQQRIGFEQRRVQELERQGQEETQQTQRQRLLQEIEDSALSPTGRFEDLSPEAQALPSAQQRFNRLKAAEEKRSETERLERFIRRNELEASRLGLRQERTNSAISSASRIATKMIVRGEEFSVDQFPSDVRRILSDEEIQGIFERHRLEREERKLTNKQLNQEIKESMAKEALLKAQAQSASVTSGAIKPTAAIVSDLSSLGNTISEFKRVRESFEPGRVGMGARARNIIQEFVPGIEVFSPEEETFRAAVSENIAQRITSLAGTAISEREAQLLLGGIPKLEDKPIRFEAKLENTIRSLEQLLSRKARAFGLRAEQFGAPVPGQTVEANIEEPPPRTLEEYLQRQQFPQ